jgi:hypothetical protein
MCQYLVVQYTMKYKKYVPVSSCTIHDETTAICASTLLYSTRWSIINMCQYVVVQYTTKHQKYVSVSSCTVHDKTSEICVGIFGVKYMSLHKYVPKSNCRVHGATSEICETILLNSTLRNIRNRCQYLVVQYTKKHQKYVPVSSCTVHDNTSEICVSI